MSYPLNWLSSHQAGKEDAISLLKDPYAKKFHTIILIPTTIAKIKIQFSPSNQQNSSSFYEIS
jgi:hypothetical protein